MSTAGITCVARAERFRGPGCEGCRYVGALDLGRWCRHPAHLGPISATKLWPYGCKDRTEWLDFQGPRPAELHPDDREHRRLEARWRRENEKRNGKRVLG